MSLYICMGIGIVIFYETIAFKILQEYWSAIFNNYFLCTTCTMNYIIGSKLFRTISFYQINIFSLCEEAYSVSQMKKLSKTIVREETGKCIQLLTSFIWGVNLRILCLLGSRTKGAKTLLLFRPHSLRLRAILS